MLIVNVLSDDLFLYFLHAERAALLDRFEYLLTLLTVLSTLSLLLRVARRLFTFLSDLIRSIEFHTGCLLVKAMRHLLWGDTLLLSEQLLRVLQLEVN